MRILFILCLFCAITALAQPELPGSYAAGLTTVQLQRNGRALAVTIYYPALTAGTGTVPDTPRAPYPVIVFGHGFLTQVSWYASLLRHLTSHGYIVVAPQFPDTQHGELADDMLYLIDWMHEENKRQLSLFFRLVDTLHTGVTGHSMGGGASLLALTRSDGIQLAAPMAPAETTPSVIASINRARAPIVIIAAANDGITPVSGNQQPMYNNALPFKFLTVLKGANHTKFMDNASLDFSDPRGYLSRPEQLRLARRYVTAACNLVLRGDTLMRAFLFGYATLPDTQATRNYAAGPVPPWVFKQYGPEGALAARSARFTWQPSLPLFTENTVTYVLRLSSLPLLRDSAFAYYYTADTAITITDLPAGNWYWQVVARTSDSTATPSTRPMPITVPGTTEVTGEHKHNGAFAYLQPNGEVLKFSGLPEGVVRLYAVTGEHLAEAVTAMGHAEITVTRLPAGIYIWALRSAYGTVAGKVLLRK